MMASQQLYLLLEHVSNKMEKPIPLIFAYQNVERPPKPYGTIRLDTFAMPDHEIYFPVDERGFQEFGSWRRATVELQIYGRNAGPVARRFALSLSSNSSLEEMQRRNVAIGRKLFLSEVPALLNESQYEERGIYQFEFYYTDQMEDDVGLIEEVEISGDCKQRIRAHPPYTPEHPEAQNERS